MLTIPQQQTSLTFYDILDIFVIKIIPNNLNENTTNLDNLLSCDKIQIYLVLSAKNIKLSSLTPESWQSNVIWPKCIRLITEKINLKSLLTLTPYIPRQLKLCSSCHNKHFSHEAQFYYLKKKTEYTYKNPKNKLSQVFPKSFSLSHSIFHDLYL